MSSSVTIYFSQGTLIIENDNVPISAISHLIKYDERVKQYRVSNDNKALMSWCGHVMGRGQGGEPPRLI